MIINYNRISDYSVKQYYENQKIMLAKKIIRKFSFRETIKNILSKPFQNIEKKDSN